MKYRKPIETVELETEILWLRMCINLGYRIPLDCPPLPFPVINGVNDANQNPTA